MGTLGPIERLPEPAGKLWERARDRLDRCLRESLPSYTGWCLGGGTILTAQWSHRESFDIDLKFPANTGLGALDPAHGSGFDDAMRALGAQPPRYGANQIVVPIDHGKIDLLEGRTIPGRGRYSTRIGSHDEQVLSNAQILAGKLIGRGLEPPTRDLYDVAVAAETDPEALQIAVNCIPRATWEQVIAHWHETFPFHAEQAGRTLRSVPRKWVHLAVNPARAAMIRGDAARYADVRIRVREQTVEIRTRCADQSPRTRVIDGRNRERIGARLDACGINAYLDASPFTNAETTLDKIDKALGNPHTVVYEARAHQTRGRDSTTGPRDERE